MRYIALLRRCRLGALVWLLITLLALAGCQPRTTLPPETEENAYQRGMSLLKEDRPQEALHAFLQVISDRDDSSESHFEAGRIYLYHIEDPVAAIYHFRRYLELKPNTPTSERVRDLIKTAEKKFARQLPGNLFASQLDQLDLLDKLTSLEEENVRLKREVAALDLELNKTRRALEQAGGDLPAPSLRTLLNSPMFTGQPPGDNAAAGGNQDENALPPPPPTYTVQPGDTLSSISINLYGTTARWRDIFQANRDILPNPHALKVGQELKVP